MFKREMKEVSYSFSFMSFSLNFDDEQYNIYVLTVCLWQARGDVKSWRDTTQEPATGRGLAGPEKGPKSRNPRQKGVQKGKITKKIKKVVGFLRPGPGVFVQKGKMTLKARHISAPGQGVLKK